MPVNFEKVTFKKEINNPMKQHLFFAFFISLVVNISAQEEKKPIDSQKEYEDLKKELEEIRYKPISRGHFAWFARCEKNEECKKKLRDNLRARIKAFSQEELSEMVIEGVLAFDGYCTGLEEYEQQIEEHKKAVNDVAQDLRDLVEDVSAYRKFNRLYHFTVGGMLITGGVACMVARNASAYIKILGGSSIGVGVFSLIRVFLE